ncbi:MAG TPA: tetratricopeptide repeat protein [Pirellulales bacterium]|nr:tetratricopeptide repeat protein [Pirellulales bacterium]
MHTIPEALEIARAALRSGDRQQSRFIYERILAALPDEPTALSELGMLCLGERALDEAERYLRRALELRPQDPVGHNNLYLVLRASGRNEQAIETMRSAIALAPYLPELHNNLGIALKDAGQLEVAADSFREALVLRPVYAEAYYNLANTLVLAHELDEAEAAFRRAVELAPSDSDTRNNFGALLRLRGKLDEAAGEFEAALATNPSSAEAHQNRAVLRLLRGQFAEGWVEYESRWQMPGAKLPNYAEPRWRGEPLVGRTLRLWAEQGLGDTIQFVRYAPLVRAQGARILLDCPPALRPLLATAAGIDAFDRAEDPREWADYHVPLLSLPSYCNPDPSATAHLVPYLRPQPNRVAFWRERLADVADFKVGITWQGSPGYAGDYFRSLPLAWFAKLSKIPGVRLFSLQKNFGREQLLSQSGVVDLADELDEEGRAFTDTAAAIANMDLVISSDTAVAHLAGALGAPVWVVLQQTPNWRWLLAREDSPWYPSMRLFRQSTLGNWKPVFDAIARELAALAQSNAR